MEFSNEQKLIVAMLADIHQALDIRDSLDAEFILDKVSSDRTWALRWRYGELFDGDFDTPEHVKFVVKVLDLWHRIEHSYSLYDDAEKAELLRLSPVFGAGVAFSGFDGNGGDRDGYGTVHILVEELGRWSRFKGRDLNSHGPMAEVYERMLEASQQLNGNAKNFELSVEDLATILNAKTHPENHN